MNNPIFTELERQVIALAATSATRECGGSGGVSSRIASAASRLLTGAKPRPLANPRLEALLSSGTHEAALADLLAGRADLAALAEEPWRQLRDSDPAAASRLIELWRSEPLPSAPIVCVHSAATACDKIGAALLEAGSESAAAARGLAAGWSELEGASAFAPPQA